MDLRAVRTRPLTTARTSLPLAGALTVIHQLADLAYLPTLIGQDRLLGANGKLAAAQSAAQVSGQGIGGVLVAWLTAPIVVLLDTATYLFFGLAIAGILHSEPAPTPPRVRKLHAEAAEGLRHLFHSRTLRALVGGAATFNLANEIFMIGLLLWMARELHTSAALIGLILSLGAVGAFAGAALGARISTRFGFGPAMLTTMAIGNGAPLAAFATTTGVRYRISQRTQRHAATNRGSQPPAGSMPPTADLLGRAARRRHARRGACRPTQRPLRDADRCRRHHHGDDLDSLLTHTTATHRTRDHRVTPFETIGSGNACACTSSSRDSIRLQQRSHGDQHHEPSPCHLPVLDEKVDLAILRKSN